jgi:acetyl esterase
LQALINPSPDLACKGRATPGSETEKLLWYGLQYVQKEDDLENPYASPALSENLRELPPAFICVAEFDDLREDGERYAEMLRDSGVEVEVYMQKGIGHLAGDGARASSRAMESLDAVCSAIHKCTQKLVFDFVDSR